MIFSIIEEVFLNSYFSLEVLVGNHVDIDKSFFMELSRIYILSEERAKALYEKISTDTIKEIDSQSSYNLYKRVQSLKGTASLTEYEMELDELADIKGKAIQAFTKEGFEAIDASCPSATFTFLTSNAQVGNILSLRMLGILECMGALAEKNLENGLSHLKKCAKWNDRDGILAYIYFEAEKRDEYLDKLHTITKRTPFVKIGETACQRYGRRVPEMCELSELLESAFSLGHLKRESYSAQSARALYSPLLSIADKKKLILNNSAQIAEVNDLPIGLNKEELVATNELELPILKRVEEIESVCEAIDIGSHDSCDSLGLISPDKFITNEYISGIKNAYPQANVQKIEVSELNESDFFPSKDNIFVRSCLEGKTNIFIIVLRGRIEKSILESVAKFLTETGRRSFHLSHPSITLDMSAVTPVCITDGTNAPLARSCASYIELEPINESEREVAVYEMLDSARESFQLDTIDIEEDALNELTQGEYEMSEISNAVIKSVRTIKRSKSEKTVTLALIEKHLGTHSKKYGFRGV